MSKAACCPRYQIIRKSKLTKYGNLTEFETSAKIMRKYIQNITTFIFKILHNGYLQTASYLKTKQT